ncbi:pseudouridine synthase [Cladochytrium replicatum]|nr:pseudouridine synthase [Cladochytrium replicatum]
MEDSADTEQNSNKRSAEEATLENTERADADGSGTKRVRTDETEAPDGAAPAKTGTRNVNDNDNDNDEEDDNDADGVPRSRKSGPSRRGKQKTRGGAGKLKGKRAIRQEEWGPRPRNEDDDDEIVGGVRIPKRKVALMMGYCGTGYNGMQVNPGVKTIESELFVALEKAGAMGFQRAARTDRGVHAAGQVVSLKMNVEPPTIIEDINTHLPEQIRVWGFANVQRKFNSKNACDARIYEYLLPTYILRRPERVDMYPRSGYGDRMGAVIPEKPSFDKLETPIETPEERQERRKNYRMSREDLAKLREILKAYMGTQNYHNFTTGKAFGDTSAKRYIMKFEAGDPFVREDIELVSLKVLGQSFMIHQIRRMVGFAIMLIRTECPVSLVSEAFKKTRMNIPRAPGLGLLLRQTVFRTYNLRSLGPGSERPPIDFDQYKETIDAFTEKWIYSGIVAEEKKTFEFDNWIRGIDERASEIRWYLTKDGKLVEEDRPKYEGLKGDIKIDDGEDEQGSAVDSD